MPPSSSVLSHKQIGSTDPTESELRNILELFINAHIAEGQQKLKQSGTSR